MSFEETDSHSIGINVPLYKRFGLAFAEEGFQMIEVGEDYVVPFPDEAQYQHLADRACEMIKEMRCMLANSIAYQARALYNLRISAYLWDTLCYLAFVEREWKMKRHETSFSISYIDDENEFLPEGVWLMLKTFCFDGSDVDARHYFTELRERPDCRGEISVGGQIRYEPGMYQYIEASEDDEEDEET